MNEKLALSDDILMKIEKPARYIGNEVNAVVKDLNNIDVRFCMCFPDVYEIGMSHLGIQILYGMLNSWDDVWCERVYSPWVDLDAIMRKENIPLFALESQDPVKDFRLFGNHHSVRNVLYEYIAGPGSGEDPAACKGTWG